MITGKKLNDILNLNSNHSLYREDGKWYHHLKAFPGILFDINGYLIFKSKDEYAENSHLQHGKDLHVIGGISRLSGYVAFSEEDKNRIIDFI